MKAKNIIRTAIIIGLFISNGILFCQEPVDDIGGGVYEANTSPFLPLPEAIVNILGTDFSAISVSPSGGYQIFGVPCNLAYSIGASLPGYKTSVNPYVLVVCGGQNTLNFYLEKLDFSVETVHISRITNTGALSGGVITGEATTITEKGVCWSKSLNPTYSDSHTSDGDGGESFTSSLTDLEANITCHVRAYARSDEGITYGDDIEFTTPATVTDIDNNVYNTVIIGSQIWMAENLKTIHYKDGTGIPLVEDPTAWDDIYISHSQSPAYCWYNNQPEIYENTYGAIYNGYAVNTNDLCPDGWHVPSNDEFTALVNYLEGELVAGGKLKEEGTSHWDAPNAGGTNESGFTALPGGFRQYNSYFYEEGGAGFWWCSTENENQPVLAWSWQLYSINGAINNWHPLDKANGFSVRCIKGDQISLPTVSTEAISAVTPVSATVAGNVSSEGVSTVTAYGVCWSTDNTQDVTSWNRTEDGSGLGLFSSNITLLDPGTTYYVRAYATNINGTAYGEELSFITYEADAIYDIDGNYYHTVKIGNQYWFQENLKVMHYRNGDPIPEIADLEVWSGLEDGAYCNYDNDASNVYLYGRLYNQYATTDSRGLCPTDYHVPSADEWIALEDYLMANGYKIEGLPEDEGQKNIAKSMASETGWLLDESKPGLVGNPDYPEYKNKSGFTGLPAGYRYEEGDWQDFHALGYGGVWWSTTDNETDPTTSPAVSLWSGAAYVVRSNGLEVPNPNDPKVRGFSVRCLHDPVVVINTNDVGEGSLRNAIDIANSNPEVTYITFDIPDVGPHKIQPSSPLPPIDDAVTIDGYSQPGSSAATETEPATLLIELDGTYAGPGTNGLTIASDNCVIRGLVINKFSGSGIYLDHANNNIVEGNYIGTNPSGNAALGNTGSGIEIQNGASNNTIGSGNLISGNGFAGVVIAGELTTGNIITDNLIGTDYSGNSIISNGDDGIHISDASGNTVSGNVLCGAGTETGEVGNNGIEILGANAYENIITGNYIGTNSDSDPGLGNGFMGIQIKRDAHNNTIGPDNVISGNLNHGILIERDNFQGQGTSANYNTIFGNRIGTSVEGTAPLGNYGCGIMIKDYASNNTIGPENLISGNYNSGILILEESSVGNEITSNSIYSNGGLGIDLGGDGVTQNDIDDYDIDFGPNNLQNFPVIESVSFSPGYVTINGYLNSIANEDYTLQFFANKVADESGNGEGHTYLEPESGEDYLITTDGTGNATISITLPIKGSYGQVITATATDKDRNTSEFSKVIGGLADQEVGTGWPLKYKYNVTGAEEINDGSDITAIKNAFQTWSSITSANQIKFEEDVPEGSSDGSTEAKYANATDEINLVSFVDDQYDWVPGVLAYAAKTVQMDANGISGKIIDADIIVNPQFKDVLAGTYEDDENVTDGYYDIQSILTHEIGHVLGLIHSGVINATMFFWLQDGTTSERTPEHDDIAWASYKYPNDLPDNTYSTISGNITYGYGGDPVAGALVTAENTSTGLSFHTYSDATGDYTVPVLAGQSYYLNIQPLDGDVYGYPMTPANISSYIYSNTIYTDYPDEYYNIGDNDGGLDTDGNPTDDGNKKDAIADGSTGINIVTNKDVINPFVISITPDNGLPVDVLPDIIIKFSEPVDLTSFTDASSYLKSGGKSYYGSVTELGYNSDVIIFTPNEALPNKTKFSLNLIGEIDANTTGITDLKGNPLEVPDPYYITTIEADITPPSITSTIPKESTTGVFITDIILVSFSEPMNKTSVQDGFTLSEDNTSTSIDGQFSWNGESTNLTFNPSQSLLENTSYTFIIPGTSEDIHGNKLGSDQSVTFTTVNSAMPTVVYRGPIDGKTKVSVSTPVVIDFSEPIDPSTITQTSFELDIDDDNDGVGDGNPLPGTFEFLNSDSRVIFWPQNDLQFGKKYIITLSESIADVSNPVQYLDPKDQSPTTFTTSVIATGPYISFIDPLSGVPGDFVMISGEGFNPTPSNNTVTFGDAQAFVKTSTLSEITCIVPQGALSGMVPVTVDGVTSEPGFYFYVSPPMNELPTDWAVANVNTGSNSRDVAIRLDATTAYVTNPGSNSVSVIDMNDLTVAKTISVGSTPLKIDINPAGTRAYVTNFGSHTVSVINLDNNQVIDEINVGINPYGVAVTPDGNHVYVANYSSNNLSVIDVNENSGGFDHVVANVNTSTSNRDIAITADAGLVLVAGDNGLTIINIDADNEDFDCFNCVVANANSGTKTRDITVMGDATYAIVSTENGLLLIVDVLPSSDLFGTAVASANSASKIKDVTAQGEALLVYVTTENNEVQIFEINPGGVPVSDGSYTGTISLSLVATITNAGNEGIVVDPRNERILAISSSSSADNQGLNVIKVKDYHPEIQYLTYLVQELVNDGILHRANGNELISFLVRALDYIEEGKTKNAINRLNSFIVKVQDYVKSTRLNQEQGQPLIDMANSIINWLKGNKSDDSEASLNFDVTQSIQDIITETRLGSIYPNPSRESVTINYDIADNELNGSKVTLRIYDVLGRIVGELANGIYEPGHYSVTWNGFYENGRPAPKGIYYIRFVSGDTKTVKRVMLVR